MHRTTAAAIGALVALTAVLGWMALGESGPAFRKLPLAYRLTQKRAVELTVAQMHGLVPLRELELDIGAATTRAFEAPTLRDIMLSMQSDCTTRRLDGICAMNYNVPVSVCYLPALGSERDLFMYNLRMTGYSRNITLGDESTLLCDEGRTRYGYERFEFVWIEFWDSELRYQFVRVPGLMSRVVQHLAWLNQGVTVCDPMSAQQQADVLFRVMEEFRPVN